jgi:nucleoside-diphosphate-sugar epimerase
MDTLKDKTIAVTGASGFLGRYIVKVLHEAGAQVVAVVRNPEKVPELKRDGIELRLADLSDTAAMANAFRGCDAVIANAGQVSLNPDYDVLIRQNMDGTRNSLQACADAGVARVITISSASVYQKLLPDIAIDESAPLRTANDKRHRFSIYAISKSLAEQEGWRLAESLQLQMTSIRPYSIYGAFDQHSFSHWYEWLLRWPVATPYPVGLNLPMIYAGDLAEAICGTIDCPAANGKAFNVGGENIDFWDFYNIWAAAGGDHPAWRIMLPVPFKRLYSDALIRQTLHWQPRSFEDGCREVIETLRRGSHFG